MSILSKKQYIFFLRGALPHHRAGGDSQEGRGSTCAPHTGHASWRSGVAGPGAVTRCSPRSSPGRGRCPPARSPGGQPDRALSPPSTLNVSQPVTGWFACMKSKPPTVYFLTRQARDLAGGGGLPEGWLRGDRAVEPRGLQRLRHMPTALHIQGLSLLQGTELGLVTLNSHKATPLFRTNRSGHQGPQGNDGKVFSDDSLHLGASTSRHRRGLWH